MGTDGALVAVLADKFAEYRHTMPILQTTPATAHDTPETANLKTDPAYSLSTLPVGTGAPAGGPPASQQTQRGSAAPDPADVKPKPKRHARLSAGPR